MAAFHNFVDLRFTGRFSEAADSAKAAFEALRSGDQIALKDIENLLQGNAALGRLGHHGNYATRVIETLNQQSGGGE